MNAEVSKSILVLFVGLALVIFFVFDSNLTIYLQPQQFVSRENTVVYTYKPKSKPIHRTKSKTKYLDEMIHKFEAINEDFFPRWFWDASLYELADKLNAKRRSTGTKLSYSKSDGRQGSWAKLDGHIQQYFLYDPADPAVEDVLHDMATLPFEKIDLNTIGEQLKMNVKFKGGGWAVMKAMRYPRYYASRADAERHYSEIAAFHADRVLGNYRVPPTVGRFVNITSDMLPLLPKEIKNTVHIKVCFYGHCPDFCNKAMSFCGHPDMIEVSLMYFLPTSTNTRLIIKLSPWRDVWYGRPVEGWISYEHVCNQTKMDISKGETAPLEIMDVRFFDLIIDNFDRHHYATYDVFENDTVPILFDNGRGFPDPTNDTVFNTFESKDGCCAIKKSTFLKFLKLGRGPDSLSQLMRRSLRRDPVHPVLMEEYYVALDRRVKKIILYIKMCIKIYGLNEVIIDDIT